MPPEYPVSFKFQMQNLQRKSNLQV
jgi:hypothetical protein